MRKRFIGLNVWGGRRDPWQIRDPHTSESSRRGSLRVEPISLISNLEKPLEPRREEPYRKPTQVGEASSLRCTREPSFRNSAIQRA